MTMTSPAEAFFNAFVKVTTSKTFVVDAAQLKTATAEAIPR
jgi:hypothetical protein